MDSLTTTKTHPQSWWVIEYLLLNIIIWVLILSVISQLPNIIILINWYTIICMNWSCFIFSNETLAYFMTEIIIFDCSPYPDGVYTPAWSVHSKATLLPLPPECTLQPHSEYYRCTLGCHSMDLVELLTNRNTLQRHFKCTPGGMYTPLPLP